MKTIIIYIKDSFYKYAGIYEDFQFNIDDLYHLEIFKRNKFTGEEFLVATFRNWDYFKIEEDPDE